MKVLITSGPTREPIDDVRYISNASSGRMGAALAEEAVERGHSVFVVHGPLSVALPKCDSLSVQTAAEMANAVMAELKGGYELLISAAAIADYRPQKISGKIHSGRPFDIRMLPTTKLIDAVRHAFPKLFIVAFKAEWGLDAGRLEGIRKDFLEKRAINLVFANDIRKNPFGSEESELFEIGPAGVKSLGRRSKRGLAKGVWDSIEEQMHQDSHA